MYPQIACFFYDPLGVNKICVPWLCVSTLNMIQIVRFPSAYCPEYPPIDIFKGMQRTAGNDRDQTHSQVWRYSAVGYVKPLGNCRNPREGRWIQHPKSCFFRPKNLSRAIQLLKNWTPTTSNMGLSENTVPIKITIG